VHSISDDNCCVDDFEDCNNDDMIDDYERELDEEVLPGLMTQQQLTEQDIVEKEARKDEEFFQSFMSDIHKPALDSRYKYPKISVMVSSLFMCYQNFHNTSYFHR
jgi:hypothetical protein